MEDASCLYRTAGIAYIVPAISVEERFDRINVINLVWNFVFCTAVVSLPLSAFSMLWNKLKWLTIVVFGGYFIWRHNWVLGGLTIFTPIVAALIGILVFRSPVGLIQEFFMLQLGHVKIDPSPEVARYLQRSVGK